MEKVFAYLKRSLTISWKSVFFNFKQYVCFFIAIIIVQLLYGMMAVSAANNNAVELAHIQENYDYHMSLLNLNEDQTRYLVYDEGTVFKSDMIFKVVRSDDYENYFTGEKFFDVYLRFVGEDMDWCLQRFEKTYEKDLGLMGSGESTYTKSLSPLFTYKNNIVSNNLTFLFITAILLVVCIFLLTSLYNIRLSQYKFQYGIYLTFGADFKMLFGTAFWELFVIFIVTFVPSVALSAGLSYLIYQGNGIPFVFSWLSVLELFFFTLAVILASVWTPMRLMSVKDPMSLIVTEDNSNLVSSPRQSVNIFMEKFPTKYEIYSMWRFRKYNVQLLTSAIVFCALFIMGLYLADIYTTDLEYPRPQFRVDLADSGFVYEDFMSRELYEMEGVGAVEIDDESTTTEGYEKASHILVKKGSTRPFAGLLTYSGKDFDPGEERYAVSSDVVYKALPEEQLQILQSYRYEGDLSCVLTPGYVVVGDSISNIPTYNFKIGDKIYASVKTGQIKKVDDNLSGQSLLKSQIEYFHYDYVELTVGAVLYDIPCGSTPVYMNLSDYETVTGKEPEATAFNVYVDSDITPAQVQDLFTALRDWGSDYGEVSVTNTDLTLRNTVARDKHYNELYVAISLMLLAISPLIWFFSQSLYYAKREKEFNILRSIGAVAKEIRAIYLQGGFTMAGLSLLVSVILSYAGSYALFLLYNVAMPYFTGENVRYVFYMPWYAILTSIVMSVFCGFFSTYLPYRSYAKYRYSLENGGAGAEFGGEE